MKYLTVGLVDSIMGIFALSLNFIIIKSSNLSLTLYLVLVTLTTLKLLFLGRKGFLKLVNNTKKNIITKYQYNTENQIIFDLDTGKKVFFEGYVNKKIYRGFLYIENDSISVKMYDKKKDIFVNAIQSLNYLPKQQAFKLFLDATKDFKTVFVKDGYLDELNTNLRGT